MHYPCVGQRGDNFFEVVECKLWNVSKELTHRNWKKTLSVDNYKMEQYHSGEYMKKSRYRIFVKN